MKKTVIAISTIVSFVVVIAVFYFIPFSNVDEFKITEEDCKNKINEIKGISDPFERINQIEKSDPPPNSIKNIDGYDDIFFVSCPLLTFKTEYGYDLAVGDEEFKHLLVAQKKLEKSTVLPIVSIGSSANMKAIQLGLSPEIRNTMSETEIALKIRQIVDVKIYVFFEEAEDDERLSPILDTD